ncbi:VCBS repeat-containing protein [Aliifodinibius sp. S!AR15-10]|uniref:FG-GAP repeat domain-containing protein n=1 Tax=Aliifodinibius sp. S!AR15-10 TaxID=2950437 RepID=UPI002861AB5C|nr:VCBS repeat-containing protein [Aliifodinibius sp. S!AR15-10]MDR8392623.1 VCBS repeat-containing protein [Aliifodinibius sp. S!AR15-10]
MFDANEDGNLDLYVTSGGNSYSHGAMALLDRLYFGDGKGGFARSGQMLPSLSSLASTATVEVGDFNGDGHMDLFVGERLQLFAVGLPARGFLLEGDGKGRFKNVTSQWATDFSELGMITDAAWTDWDLDGREDLVVVGEWMGVQVYQNTGSQLKNISGALGLSDTLSGWWNVVHPADLNKDGRMDLVLGNHGLNSRFEASQDHPVKMWVGDFERNGQITQILSMPKDGKDYSVALRHELLEQMPSLEEKYPNYASYGGQTIQDIFSSNQLAQAQQLQASELPSIIVWNKPDGVQVQRLPLRTQFSPIYGIWSGDLNGDNFPELLMGGNMHEVKPIAGQYNASYGAALSTDDRVFTTWRSSDTGWFIPGATRDIASVKMGNGNTLLVVARNNNSPMVFHIICTYLSIHFTVTPQVKHFLRKLKEKKDLKIS